MLRRTTMLLFALLFAAAATAEVVTVIHLDAVPDVACGETWVQDGVTMYFTATTAEDCDGGGSCFYDVGGGPDGVWLFPARLVADFGERYLVYRVEVDVIDWCGVGCTQAFLYDAGLMVGTDGNGTVSSPEVLTVQPSTGYADMFAVSSCEGQILGSTIRIYSDVVPTDASSWGGIKAMFR